MKYIVYSNFGRCGSTLLSEIIGAYLYNEDYEKEKKLKPDDRSWPDPNPKYILFANYQHQLHELERYKVIHTHQINEQYHSLIKSATMCYCTRKDVVESISSHLIAQYTKVYNHFSHTEYNSAENWKNIPTEKLTCTDEFVKDAIYSHHTLLTQYQESKQQNPNTYLFYYEDWIGDFNSLPFTNNFKYTPNFDNFNLCKKVPVSKKEWVDYPRLIQQVNNFKNSFPQIEIQ